MVDEDGALRPTLTRLEDAISALCDPVQHIIDGKRHWTPSWYRQLQDSLPGAQGDGGGGTRLVSVWIDCLQLIIEIDDAVQAWQPAGYDTPDRLHQIESRKWRPQDTKSMDQISGNLEAWKLDIVSLLVAERHWTLPAPCPACGAKLAYRKDSAGEVVRQAALSISPDGCTCGKCRTVWPPEKFEWLARVLGYEMLYEHTDI